MNDEELVKIIIPLRRMLKELLVNFWEENKRASREEMLFINSAIIGSLISEITYSMFKKDIGIEIPLNYIDNICTAAKIQFKDGVLAIQNGLGTDQ